ncbi:MAG: ParB N-terminal domain-containing protein [Candidatus Spechtbacteria bacterium]|nr:ParB N-terminal domain-containing protein [Candidatus Spechtbacteria bacterium]
MRRTFDEQKIERLAANIDYHGMIHALSVADTEEGYILISGEKRVRACNLLEERGKHIGDVFCNIFEGLTPVAMALLQASENIHEQVPSHEEAWFFEKTWHALKIVEPKFTLTDFADAVGRSEQTIRNALRFALLPERIQGFVSSGLLTYGAAVQLVRVKEMLDDGGLEQWAIRCVISKAKVSEVRAQIDTYIKDVSSGQLNMLDVFEENARNTLEQDSRRILIDRTTTTSFWSGITYLKRLLFLFENGKLELEDLPWLRRNPRRAFLELMSVEDRVLDHMKTVLSSQEAAETNRILKECESIFSANSS